MAVSDESLVLFKKRQKYCYDPFKKHKSKRTKNLRNVTDRQTLEQPSLLSVGEKIRSSCRTRLGVLSPEAETESQL